MVGTVQKSPSPSGEGLGWGLPTILPLRFADMVTKHRILILSAVAFAIAAPATAGRFGGGDMMATFDQADANHDGMITRAEFIAARLARFAEMDRNHDGVVSKDDFSRLAKFRPEAADRLDMLIAQADADHDGRMTRAEIAAAPTPIFDRADSNHDGVIDKSELAQLRTTTAMMKRKV
ncbi:EF hand [Sphingomonas sp. YR710]|nr:EF hand [Sphingomonas sp. YR710]